MLGVAAAGLSMGKTDDAFGTDVTLAQRQDLIMTGDLLDFC